jgi:hypothetical protein
MLDEGLKMKRRIPIGALLCAVAASGCNRHVFSPPARIGVLESAATVGQGRTGVQVEGSDNGSLLGPDVTTGTLQGRHGISRSVDLSLSSSFVHIKGGAHENPNALTHRAGAKLGVARWFAVDAGLGAGYSAAGAFVSPDLGVVAAWENPYLVPFYGLTFLASVPIGPRSVDVSHADETPGTHLGKPKPTFGVGSLMGLRVPLLPGAKAPRPNEIQGSLLLGWRFLFLADSEDDESFTGFAGAGEITF